jgi:hypothetical protein
MFRRNCHPQGDYTNIVNGNFVETCNNKLILKNIIYGIVYLLALIEFVNSK